VVETDKWIMEGIQAVEDGLKRTSKKKDEHEATELQKAEDTQTFPGIYSPEGCEILCRLYISDTTFWERFVETQVSEKNFLFSQTKWENAG